MNKIIDLLQNKWAGYLFSEHIRQNLLPELRAHLKKDLEKGEGQTFDTTKAYLDALPEEEYLELLEAYVFFNGGKRVRPLLMLASYSAIKNLSFHELMKAFEQVDFPYPSPESLGLNPKKEKTQEQELSQLFHLFTALECLHTYSLVHDDLPSMDNDAFRRGAPTVHTFTDEAIAILIGDTLGARAQKLILQERAWTESYQKASFFIIQKSSSQGMILGQVLDLRRNLKEEKIVDPIQAFERVKKIHKHKTGDMIEASLLVPAYLLNLEEAQFTCLQKFAQNIGLAFQIKDDILDVEAEESLLGKTKGKDQADGKWSSVNVIGLEESKRYLEKIHAEGLSLLKELKTLGLNTEALKQMYKMLVERKY